MNKENVEHPTANHYLALTAPIQDLMSKFNLIKFINFGNYKQLNQKDIIPLMGFACSESIHEIHRPRHISHRAISPVQSADTNSDVAPEMESNGTHKT